MDREAFVKELRATRLRSTGVGGGAPHGKLWLRSPLLCAALSVLLGACSTSLTVVPFDESKPETAVGVPFPLMFTRYDLEIKRQVIACLPRLTVKVTAELKGSKSAPDPEKVFTLQPNSLSGALKTSAVKTTYHLTGSPGTLNASAEDKTGAVVANVAGAAAKIVAIGAGNVFFARGGETVAIQCVGNVADALRDAKKDQPKVASAGALVEKLTSDLANLMKRAAVTGNNPDQATKRELSKTAKSLADAIADAAAKTEGLGKKLKVLTSVTSESWPTHGDMGIGTLSMPKEPFLKWAQVVVIPAPERNGLRLSPAQAEAITNSPPLRVVPAENTEDAQRAEAARVKERTDPAENAINAARAELDVALTLKRLAGAGRQSLDVPQKVDPGLGVPYRAPAPGRLRVCAGQTCGEDDAALVQADVQVQQLGHVYYLPCTSRPFSSIACTLEFAETGELKSAGTENKAAAAEGLTAAAKDVLTQVATAKEAKAAAGNKGLEAKNAALKLQVENAKLEASLSPNASQAEIDALKLETELANSKRAIIEAREALEEAEAKAR
jgi:hypothetical protein